MKSFLCCLMAGILAITFITGCKKDKTFDNATVTAVTSLFAPEDNAYIKLDPLSGTASFQWAQALASDNGLILYEVAFDTVGGNFAKPLYSLPSDGNGLYNTLTMTYKQLNTIADMAGIQPQEVGKLNWTVISSKGINTMISAASRSFSVERPAGFSTIPADLFITGTATEGGTDVSKAIHFKQTAAGIFEAYTSLQAGTYQLVDHITGTPVTYSINGTRILQGGTSTVTGDTKVEKIIVDFTAAAASMNQVVSVGLWFAADNKIWYNLPYTGKGTWEIDNASVVFAQESWGRDNRYKFMFTMMDASGATTTPYFGSVNSDNQNADANTPAYYFYMVPVNNSQFDYCFKFSTAADNATANIQVNFGPDIPAYTNSVIVQAAK